MDKMQDEDSTATCSTLSGPPEIYTVYARSVLFELYRSQIETDSPNYFTAAFDSGWTEGSTRTVYTDRHPQLFSLIADYLSGYEILPLQAAALPPSMSLETATRNLLHDAEYFQLDGLVEKLKPQSVVLPRFLQKCWGNAVLYPLSRFSALDHGDLMFERKQGVGDMRIVGQEEYGLYVLEDIAVEFTAITRREEVEPDTEDDSKSYYTYSRMLQIAYKPTSDQKQTYGKLRVKTSKGVESVVELNWDRLESDHRNLDTPGFSIPLQLDGRALTAESLHELLVSCSPSTTGLPRPLNPPPGAVHDVEIEFDNGDDWTLCSARPTWPRFLAQADVVVALREDFKSARPDVAYLKIKTPEQWGHDAFDQVLKDFARGRD